MASGFNPLPQTHLSPDKSGALRCGAFISFARFSSIRLLLRNHQRMAKRGETSSKLFNLRSGYGFMPKPRPEPLFQPGCYTSGNVGLRGAARSQLVPVSLLGPVGCWNGQMFSDSLLLSHFRGPRGQKGRR